VRGEAAISVPARLLAEPARAAVVTGLLDGRARAAGELAALAGVSASTVSGHLAALVAGGMLVVRRDGRRRLHALAGPEVARAVEALQALAPTPVVSSYRQSAQARRLSVARTCYDHLAGEFGVRVADELVGAGAVAPLTAGEPGELLDVSAAPRWRLAELPRGTRRPLVRGCLDWTQRRPHVAGALGAHLLTVALEAGWVQRVPHGRGLTVCADLWR
jgi:DNA-binding transcriptional ArsR family regulator